MYDVAWASVGGKVAASLSNGGVCIWDISHSMLGTEHRNSGDLLRGGFGGGRAGMGHVLGTHARTVNRVGWDPFNPHMLMSGSQVYFLLYSLAAEMCPYVATVG